LAIAVDVLDKSKLRGKSDFLVRRASMQDSKEELEMQGAILICRSLGIVKE